MRFWGMNLVAMYPTHAQADALAANLAGREVNLVRLHHNLRKSLEWNPGSRVAALAMYETDTRTPNPDAWDRFDYLNAQLRSHGIYLALSVHSSRRFLPGDVEILTTDAADSAAWVAGIAALNRTPRNLDLFKALPMLDERSARLIEEFARALLTHVNPYTEMTYGADPQVVYLETANEHSLEYAVLAGNRYGEAEPATAYFGKKLQAKWDAYTTAKGLPACDLYAPPTEAQRLARGDFLRGLDRAYFERIGAFVRGLGCSKPMEFSNLWRGEAFQKMEEALSDVVEDHSYCDPLVVRRPEDAFSALSRSTPARKPFFVGELNQAESAASIAENAPYRTMLPVAAGAYGGFNDWSGVVWFAWAHGDKDLGADGWSGHEEREPAPNSDLIGFIISDGMMLDHLRTAGMIFRRGLVAPSAQPRTLFSDEPFDATNYTALMTPQVAVQPGWQDIHAIKQAFGPVPSTQKSAPWMTAPAGDPLVTDTGEIRKDVARRQLTVRAPQAEAFSGERDDQAPTGLTHLGSLTGRGFATVIIVAADGQLLAASRNLVISQTFLDEKRHEIGGPALTLSGLRAPSAEGSWRLRRTRPRGTEGTEAIAMVDGVLTLPSDGWHEAELRFVPRDGAAPAATDPQVKPEGGSRR